jgi:hypothetical protein
MRRIISKSIAADPSRRQQSAGEYLADLHRIRGEIGNWVIDGSLITLVGDVSYRFEIGAEMWIDKKGSGDWRRQKKLGKFAQIDEVVRCIEELS